MGLDTIIETIDPITILILALIAGAVLAVMRFVFKVTMRVLRIGCVTALAFIIIVVLLGTMFPPIQ